MRNAEHGCIGCENIREQKYPVYGYSHVRKCYLLATMSGWHGSNGKPMKHVDIYYCPVCGKQLERSE